MHGIDYLLSPVTLEKFQSSYHGTTALYIEGSAEKFSSLFGWDDINNLLNYGNLAPPAIKLVHNTESIPKDGLKHRNQWLSKGATLIVNSVQKLDPLVDKFTSILSSEMNTQVNVNCYSSFPDKQGFDLHFDFHDVFIIQLEGEKSWKIYEPTLTYPIETMKQGSGAKDTAAMPTCDPYMEIDMTVGDVLYIPRGHWHYALSRTPSVHFTVGPQARSPSHFLGWLTTKAQWENEYFRKDFPIIDAGELGGRIEEENLAPAVDVFRQQVKLLMEDESLVDQFIEFIMTENKMSQQQNVDLPALGTLMETFGEDTVFEFPPGQKALVRYDPESKNALVDIRGFSLELNQIPMDLLKCVFDGRQHLTGKQLIASTPKCNWKDVKNLLLTLYQRGVLRQSEIT